MIRIYVRMQPDFIDCDISQLCEQARPLRDLGKGRTVSYSLNVFIPLTRLCRNACGYCDYRVSEAACDTFFLAPEEVLAIARAGERAGCTEALLVTGDKPELRYPDARRWLTKHRLDSTAHYACEMARLVLSETRLYPHTNAGVVSGAELAELKQVNASVGLMLETTAGRLSGSGQPHAKSPDKLPGLRLDFLVSAGQLGIPTTTGLLIGIGETRQERLDAILEICRIHQEYGHIQEVIIQNFKPKRETPMAAMSGAPMAEIMWTCASARLLLGPDMNLQVAPNLVPESSGSMAACLSTGINDWGGVSPLTPDFVNRESPWPALAKLQSETEEAGFTLRQRFPAYPEFIHSKFLSPLIRKRLEQDADEEGYVRTGALVA